MQSRMAQHIASFESFHALRIEEEQLPLTVTDRDPGDRPTEAEHPLNVFIRKCWAWTLVWPPTTPLPSP